MRAGRGESAAHGRCDPCAEGGLLSTPGLHYLDNAATTPVDPAVIAQMRACLGEDGWFANPSSSAHEAGRAAARKGTPAAALRYLRPASDVADSAALPPRVLVDLGLAEAAAGEPISLSRF